MDKIKPEKPNKSKNEAKTIAKRESKKKRLMKAARLILRNLPFKCTEDDIKNHFSKFGNILEVKLLKKDNMNIGCGFVQFDRKNNAAKALFRTSGTDFMGRPVIVDWALSKDKFASVTVKEEPQDDVEMNENDVAREGNYEVDEHIVKSENETDADESHDSGLDRSNGEESDDDDEEEEEEDDDDDDDDDEEEEEENEDDQLSPLLGSMKTEFKSESKKPRVTVADESHTVFVKNLPFSATDEDLTKCAEEHGAVNYALVCMDRMTEHSKGTGFVQFKDVEVANQVLDGKIQLKLNGTSLIALKPMTKEAVQNVNSKNKGPKDNRNLYLVKEGVILAGSPAAHGVSNSDMMKRLQLDNWKNHKLKNLHMFVSPTRLVIHNLPGSYDDAQLKELFKNNSPKGSVITESRVMKNLKNIQPSGKPKSIGYGFVAFTKHEDALFALRKLNNNPDIFLPVKRPIVAFSIENRKALHVKEKRLVNSKLAMSKVSEGKSAETSKAQGPSKQHHRRKRKSKNTETTGQPQTQEPAKQQPQKKRKLNSTKTTSQAQPAENSQTQEPAKQQPQKKRKLNSKKTTSQAQPAENSQTQGMAKHQVKQKFNKNTAQNKCPNVQDESTTGFAPFTGVTAKYGSRKLRSKRELIAQQKQHFINAKKFKKQNKISRKQKRAKKQMSQ